MDDNKTYIARVNPDDLDPLAMALAGQMIRDGGLVAFPTETVYGLGANALDAEAAAKIFVAKERPTNDPLIVHIWQREDLTRIAQNVPEIAYRLADAFWPGPLTLILHKHADVPEIITAGKDTVAVRLPAHPVARALIREADTPIAAPSANRFSRPSPTSALHVLQDLAGRVDVILNGGSTNIGVESTIVDLTTPTPILRRPGGVSLEQLREYLPNLAFHAQYLADTDTATAPGTLLKHYSPNASVKVYDGPPDAVLGAMRDAAQQHLETGQKIGILARDNETEQFGELDAQIVLLGGTGEQMAKQLFAGLRSLDSAEVDVILVRAPERIGIGLALYDRLIRSAEGQIVHVEGSSQGSGA